MRKVMPRIVTANLLRSGDVVYLGADEMWVRDIADAVVASSDDELVALEAAGVKATELQKVIEVYAMDVDVVEGKARPLSVREVIRAAHGPSI